MMRVALVCATGLVLFTAAGWGQHRVKEYDLSAGNISGDQVRGPVTITATHANPLRYDYKVNSVVAFSQPVDLWSKLGDVAAPGPAGKVDAPTLDTVPAPPITTVARKAACNTLQSDSWQRHVCDADDITAAVDGKTADVKKIADAVDADFTVFLDAATTASGATGAVKNAGKALTNFLMGTNGDMQRTLAGIKDQLNDGTADGPPSTFIQGTRAQWPSVARIAALANDSAAFKKRLDDLGQSESTFSQDTLAAITNLQAALEADAKKITDAPSAASIARAQTILGNALKNLKYANQLLTTAASNNNQMSSGLPDLEQGSQKYNDFIAARDLLLSWKSRLSSFSSRISAHALTPAGNPDPSTISIGADCDFAFSRTKTTTITLIRVDQLPGTAATPETVLSTTVECTSPFTISAGVAFSSIKEREFAIQNVATPPGSTTTTSEFVTTASSNFHPLIVGMIHARVYEPNEWLSVHASFGVAGNINSVNAGGSSVEYLMGPSISFFRTMFLTPGLHIGRENSLGAGYKAGDPVPPAITTPPLQQSYRPAFGFAVTFTKP